MLRPKACSRPWPPPSINSASLIGVDTHLAPGCEFSVKLLPETPTQTYTVILSQVEQFARFGVAKGAPGITRKNKLLELLGIGE